MDTGARSRHGEPGVIIRWSLVRIQQGPPLFHSQPELAQQLAGWRWIVDANPVLAVGQRGNQNGELALDGGRRLLVKRPPGGVHQLHSI